VRDDLDWVVMKSLEKDRARRYASANELANDIQRHLANEPILARPPSRRYQLQKMIRRNRMLFIAIASITVAILASSAVSTLLFLREKEARQEQSELRAITEKVRSNETRLLSQAKARERLARAAVLLRQNKVEEADALLVETPFDSIEPSMEAAEVFRALGEWNANNNRWEEAAACFSSLMRANRLETPERVAESSELLLPGPAILESGDVVGYEKFRSEMLDRFGECAKSSLASEHLIKITLLRPADKKLLERLNPFAQTLEKTLHEKPGLDYPSWNAAAFALLKYRQNDFTNALIWANKCMQFPDANAASIATGHCILSMAYRRLGNADAARFQIAQARLKLEADLLKFGPEGSQKDGYWYDWAVVRRLLAEASNDP
jgi:hypothetical protein